MESLKQRIAAVRQSLFDEEYLDYYFIQLEQLEDIDNPHFVEDVMTLFFRDSTHLLATIEEDFEKIPLDYIMLDKNLHQLKGSSASVGANKIKVAVDHTRELLKGENLECAKASLEQLKKEYSTLRAKLDDYFELKQQAGPFGLVGPVKPVKPFGLLGLVGPIEPIEPVGPAGPADTAEPPGPVEPAGPGTPAS